MATRRPDYDAEDALALTGEHITQWRRLLGLTQQQVADRAGISRGALVRIEAGDPGPSVDTFFRVLNALHLVDQLTGALDPMKSAVGMARAAEKLPRRVRRT
jgi:transcriptional regulator with XRE-family HTH domain